jgi:hypothetical protein
VYVMDASRATMTMISILMTALETDAS